MRFLFHVSIFFSLFILIGLHPKSDRMYLFISISLQDFKDRLKTWDRPRDCSNWN